MMVKSDKHTGFIGGILFFIMLCGSPMMPITNANADKNDLAPQDIHENIYGAEIISKTDYLIVGSRGKIFRSADSGKSWAEIQSGTRKTLYSVSFADPDNGWISGQTGLILHTTDGGKTWVPQSSGTQKHLFNISFGDASNGCAVGDWGAIVVTDDGGITWQDASLEEDVILYDIDMADAQSGCAVGEFGKIYLTDDGGRSWKETGSPNPMGLSLFCMNRDGNSLYAGGLDGLILYSKDFGKTWQSAENAVQKSIYGISMLRQTGWAVGDTGTVLRTEDSGQTWQAMDVPEAYKLFWLKAVRFHNGRPGDQSGFVAGADGLYLNIQKQHLVW